MQPAMHQPQVASESLQMVLVPICCSRFGSPDGDAEAKDAIVDSKNMLQGSLKCIAYACLLVGNDASQWVMGGTVSCFHLVVGLRFRLIIQRFQL